MSPQLIFKKIPEIMKAVGAITKDRTNTHQQYKFRGIEDMYNAFHPVFAEMGVFCAPEVLESQTSEIEGTNASGATKVSYRTLLKVRHRFYAEDGSSVDVTTMGEGIDTSDKASNKAMSAAMKYAFIELFCVPTEDIEDADRTSPEAGRTKTTDLPSSKKGSGAFCDLCETELVMSKAGTGYYCPKFKEPGGEHTRFPTEQLQGVINYQTQAKLNKGIT